MHAVRVTVICEECVRIEYAPFHEGGGPGRFCDLPSLFAIHGPAGDGSRVPEMGLETRVFTTSADAGSEPIRVRTRRFSLEYTPDGRPPHAGNMRAKIEHPAPPGGVEVFDGGVVWTPGARNRFNLGGTLSTLDGLRGPYPLGEGLLARDGWHVVDDSRRHVLVDGWAATRESQGLGPNTDWYLFAYGEDYAAALAAMTIIAGRVPMPRRCTLGSWYSRYWPYTSEEFRGIVSEYERHGFGLDVLVLDMDWHKEGWTGWSWNRELIPDPEELIAWLHGRGLAVTLNLHPADGVGPHEDRYGEFMRALGREPDGTTVAFDAGNREYMRALFERVHAPLERGGEGVDFWWVDWQQDRMVRSIPGLTNLRWLNHLYFEHTRRGASGSDPGRRGVSFSRWAGDEPSGDPDAGTEWGHPDTGGWGDHRHPIHFSGDAHTGWNMLAFQVPFTATAGNIGCFFWSHDIGGHYGPRNEEATARWVQFGALSGALRLHSARSTALDRRPWTYEGRFCESMRRAFAMRARLMPYLYTCVRACHERALPLLRPMYLGWAREGRAYRSPGQYMLGWDVLAAPIVGAGVGERCVATRQVWFPPGEGGWFDLETGDRHGGGGSAVVAADIDHAPVFVRGGVLLAMRPPTHRMGTDPLTHLVVRCYPGVDGEASEREVYEDDGETLDHGRGGFARTPLVARWAHGRRDGRATVVLEATIGPVVGAYRGQPARRTVELQIGAVHRVVSVCGGLGAELEADAAGGLARVRLGEVDIRSAARVRVEFEPADARLIAFHGRRRNLQSALGGERALGGVHLRESVVAECRADGAGGRHEAGPGPRTELLAIGAGIAASVEGGVLRVIDTLGWIDGAGVGVEFVDSLGDRERTIAGTRIAFSDSGDHAREGSCVLPAERVPEACVGLRASRRARVRFTIDGAPMLVEAVVRTALAPLTEFLVVGPFAWDWRKPIGETVYGPERSAVDVSATFEGRDGARIGWKPAVRAARWDVDFRASLGARGGLAYGATTLIATRAVAATLHFECGDKLRAFLNGEPILTLDDYAAHASRVQWVRVVLREGRNELLVKAVDGGGWGFTVGVDADRALMHERPGTGGAGGASIVG
ncbi:MAG TPA: glycoside hydrolase family 31 protein [Phycisphaerales bacterium]|nr:glycoside hydrolase family 31 protein [Phycisphaerales bacterium]